MSVFHFIWFSQTSSRGRCRQWASFRRFGVFAFWDGWWISLIGGIGFEQYRSKFVHHSIDGCVLLCLRRLASFDDENVRRSITKIDRINTSKQSLFFLTDLRILGWRTKDVGPYGWRWVRSAAGCRIRFPEALVVHVVASAFESLSVWMPMIWSQTHGVHSINLTSSQLCMPLKRRTQRACPL